MQNEIGKWLQRGSLVALAMTTIIASGCGGGGGGSGGDSSSGATSSSTTSADGNAAPTISATPTTQVAVGSAYTLAPQASDPDGDSLAFSIQNKPSWAEFSTATGQLTGTPNAQSTGATAGIVISVSDGKIASTLPAFSITVAPAGAATSAPPAAAPAATPSGPGVALSWNVPTRTIDGTTLSDLSGYRIHYGTNANALVQSVEVQSSGANSFTVQNLPKGTYFFAVRALTATGAESVLSNVISRVVS
jgi:hypothetical protein